MQTSTPLPLSLSLDPVPSFISALSVSPTVSAHRPALSVSWSPPQSDLPILNYTISYSLRDSGAVTNITTTGTRVLITKLSIGATYQVAVTARSALGEGPRSVWVHQTTFSREYGHVNLCNLFPLNNSVYVIPYCSSLRILIVPSQVTNVTLSRVVRSGAPALRVTWTTPQSDTAITHYRVRHRKSGMKDWTTRTVSGSPPRTVTYLESLSLGAVYEVQLQAESAIGRGNFSEVQTATAFDGEELYIHVLCVWKENLCGTNLTLMLLYVFWVVVGCRCVVNAHYYAPWKVL